MIRTYSELILLPTFKERFEYLKLNGNIGESTFGFNRYLNQVLYTSGEWRRVRRQVIIRDTGCDLGVDGYDIGGIITVHHMNPLTSRQLELREPIIFDPEYLISTSDLTHKAITLGDERILPKPLIVRFKNDTCPWKL